MDDDTDTSAHLLGSLETPIIQAVGSITQLDGIPGIRPFEARETNLTALLAALEEVGERAMKTFEHRINDDSRQIRMSLFAMALILFIQMQVVACFLVVGDQLFQKALYILRETIKYSSRPVLVPWLAKRTGTSSYSDFSVF